MNTSICFLGLTLSAVFTVVPTNGRNDDILSLQPPFVRKACEETCPDTVYRILRIVHHQKANPSAYTITFFNTGPGTALRKVGDDWITELYQYDLELASDGHVLEADTRHFASGPAESRR